jgi:hypothetical protein
MIVGGILYVIIGFSFLHAHFQGENLNPEHPTWPAYYLPIALIYLALGVYWLFVGYGLFVGKGWAWTTTVIAQVVGFGLVVIATLIFSFGTSSIDTAAWSIVIFAPGLIYGIIILGYMLRSTTRAYFGKVKLTQ